jgi:hypothetical protein
VALIVFSGDVQVAAPPTLDHGLVREGIDQIGSYSGFGGRRSATRSTGRCSSGATR